MEPRTYEDYKQTIYESQQVKRAFLPKKQHKNWARRSYVIYSRSLIRFKVAE